MMCGRFCLELALVIQLLESESLDRDLNRPGCDTRFSLSMQCKAFGQRATTAMVQY